VLGRVAQGHMNPEPITTRWMRGISWRMVREVIFGIGSAPRPHPPLAPLRARRVCAAACARPRTSPASRASRLRGGEGCGRQAEPDE
jgi:hypothetical protein